MTSRALTNRIAGSLSLLGAAVVLLGAMLPWSHVSKCVWQCSTSTYTASWNVLQVGGGWLPSTFTSSGLVVLAGAALLALAGLSGVQGRLMKWVPPRAKWLNVVVSAAIVLGAVTAPDPSFVANPPLYFSASQGVGPWVCLLGALLGLLGAAVFARNDLPRHEHAVAARDQTEAARVPAHAAFHPVAR